MKKKFAEIESEPQSEKSKNRIVGLYYGTAEKSMEESSMVPDTMLKPYNPDDLYQKTGDYSLYEDMLDDDQVSIALQIKKDLVLGDWYIDPVVEENEDIAQQLENTLKDDCDEAFDDYLEEILTAYPFGFSISEILFKKKDNGMLALKALKTRHPASWLIHTDKHGNVKKYEQQATKDGDLSINPKSLIHYVNNPQFQNPYGRSDLRVAYAAWFCKREVIKYYAIFLEKAASPTPVAKYDIDAPQSAVTKIFDVIKNFQTKTALTIPKQMEVEFLEAKTAGEAYWKALDIFNMFIGRALFIPDLFGFQGSETSGGSFALGESQFDMFFKHIGRRRLRLERKVNYHVLKPLTVWNHGIPEVFPRFRFKSLSHENIMENIKSWSDVVKAKVFVPTPAEINHFRSLVDFPEQDEDEMMEERERAMNPEVPNNPTDGPHNEGDSDPSKEGEGMPGDEDRDDPSSGFMIALTGPMGVGKSTIAEKLTKRFKGLEYVSVDQMRRDMNPDGNFAGEVLANNAVGERLSKDGYFVFEASGIGKRFKKFMDGFPGRKYVIKLGADKESLASRRDERKKAGYAPAPLPYEFEEDETKFDGLKADFEIDTKGKTIDEVEKLVANYVLDNL